MVEGDSEVGEFSADDEQCCPHSDLCQMCYERQEYHHGDDGKVDRKTSAQFAEFSFMTNEVYCSADCHSVDTDCAYGGTSANQQRKHDRDSMKLRHLLRQHRKSFALSHDSSDKRGD